MIWYITIKDRESGIIVKQNVAVDVVNKGNRFLDCHNAITNEWFCVDTFFSTFLISNEIVKGEIK